jgi:hypothetical protein
VQVGAQVTGVRERGRGVAFGIAVARLKLLPTWVARSSFVLAVVNLAFVPAVFFGDDAADFYSAQGWGTTASMGAVWSIWTLAVSISIIRSARGETIVSSAAGRPERVTARIA